MFNRYTFAFAILTVVGLGTYAAAPYALPQKLQYDSYLVNNHPTLAQWFAKLAFRQDTWQPRRPEEFQK